jgi:hypothetical protein
VTEEAPAQDATVAMTDEAADSKPEATPTTEDVAASSSASGSAPAPAPAYAVDESVLAILREEAEREANARAAEAQRAEPEPGLGVDAAAASKKKKKPALAVVAKDALSSESQPADDDIGLKSATRRDLLPDVEEINSTLRPSEIPVEVDIPVPAAREQSGGFRTGFLTVMTIAILGAVLYIAAPTLSRMVPAASDALSAYVGMVDSLRLSLDGMMQSATVAINGQ